jgi:PhnB protein
MASRLNPYVRFQGTARAAMEFYRDVFGGTLAMNTMGEVGRTGAGADLIMHGQLETPSGFTLMGADVPPEMAYTEGTRVGMILNGDDEAELSRYFERLVEGGSVTVPLERQMWGDIYGQCTDAFGVEWMVNISAPPA